MDFVGPRRSIALRLVSGRGHYEEVVQAVLGAQTSVWIATANLKELMVEDHRARPGVRRQLGRAAYRSILEAFAELARNGVELRILHADRPSRPFRVSLEAQPDLDRHALERRECPRVHLKAVIVDGALLYLGSANWTGAGLGARGSGRRNFELGVITDDGPLLDQIQGLYERIWSGGECKGCKLRAVCPGPLDRRAADAVIAKPVKAKRLAKAAKAPTAAKAPKAPRAKAARPARRRAKPSGSQD